jgi:hypothetical protein
MACELDIIDVPVSGSTPAATDLVLFTLADGTSVLRPFSVFQSGVVPNDAEYQATASGGTTNNVQSGLNQFTLTNFINRRVRLFRQGIKQTTIVQTDGSYFTFNSTTGTFTVVPVPSTGEIFQIEAY